ncbi:MAG: N-acetylmuramoyl-L-alanine amidase [Muribaculaceae bacterium]|nr:N-acetylmuramoyl-L-alanine amidase [Muribaculaceae bacterium]
MTWRRFFLSILFVAITMATPAWAFTVIIDPGHGGRDYGASGTITQEKFINLAVAQKLAYFLTDEMEDCKVVMTRNGDRFVTLQGRADLANKSGGDIFISIHANSVAESNPQRTTVNGASVYTLGLEKSEANMEVARRENSVITLEPDYTTTYQGFNPNSTESYIMFEIGQSADMDKSIRLANEVQKELHKTAGRKDNGVRQAPFYVLVKTAMPSILVELDFICNPQQERFMDSDEGSTMLARAIANAVRKYRHLDDLQNGTVSHTTPSTTTQPDVAQTTATPTTPAVTPSTPAVTPSTPTPSTPEPAPAPSSTTVTPSSAAWSWTSTPLPTEPAQTSTPTTPSTSREQVTEPAKPAFDVYTSTPITGTTTTAPAQQDDRDVVIYKVQFLTSWKKVIPEGDRQFKGLTGVEHYTDSDGVIKYTYGAERSDPEIRKVLAEVRRLFPQAFIIKTMNGQRIR